MNLIWGEKHRLFEDDRMAIVKDEWLIPLGVLCLAAALLVDRFIPGEGILDFIIGVLIGLSMTLNLVGLYRSRNK